MAHDVLLVRDESRGGVKFREVKMKHYEFEGCGGSVSKRRIQGKQQLLLANADASHPGHYYMLSWTQGRE